MAKEYEGLPVPRKRETWTYELVIKSQELGRFKLYMSVGIDPEGRPIEIWLDCMKEGTMLREFMHAWAALFSVSLQHRVPLAHLVKLYKEWEFQPSGPVEGYSPITTCRSVPSLLVSILELEFPSQLPPQKGQQDLFT